MFKQLRRLSIFAVSFSLITYFLYFGIMPANAATIYMTVMDCSGGVTSGDVVQAYLGDGYCDNGAWGVDLNCSAFNYDNGDCLNGGGGAGGGYTTDCIGNVASVAQIQAWLGDGYCDDGSYGLVLYCAQYNWDYGDCGFGGGNTGGGGGYTTDCIGNVASVAQIQAWLGDGYCDDGSYGLVLYCAQYNWDYGDCGFGGGNTGGGGGSYYTTDCSGNMVPLSYVQSWTGDGYCDYGQNNINLNCAAFNYDGGDCYIL